MAKFKDQISIIWNRFKHDEVGARCGCSGGSCSCTLHQLDTNCIDTTITGSGSGADPYVISAELDVDPGSATCLVCGTNGLQLVLDPAGGLTCGVSGLAVSTSVEFHDGAGPGSTYTVLSANSPVSGGTGSTAIGKLASSSATNSLALGISSTAGHADAVALGSSVSTTHIEQVNTGIKNLVTGAPNAVTADGDLINSQLTFYIDETNDTVTIKVKYSTGVVKTFLGALV